MLLYLLLLLYYSLPGILGVGRISFPEHWVCEYSYTEGSCVNDIPPKGVLV